MKKTLSILYTILLFLFVFPSGTVLHVPVKIITMALLLFFYILYRRKIVIDDLTKGILFIFLGFIIWSLFAIVNGYLTSTLKLSVNFVSLFLIIWITYEFYQNKIIESKKILKIVTIVSILIIVFNILVSLALSANILNVDSFYDFYNLFFNAAPMTVLVNLGSISLYRVQMANNTIPFIWLGYSLVLDRKILYKFFALVMVGILAVISFSRVLIAEYFVLLLGSLIIRILQNSKKTKDEAISIGFTAVVITLVLGFAIFRYGGVAIDYIQMRFNSNLTDFSDSFRDIQREYLQVGFGESPLFGHGAGSYVREYIRSSSDPYTYELEYLSFLYQYGLIGFIWVIGGTIALFYYICLNRTDNFNIKLLVILNLTIWAIKPLYNPSFLSSNSGIIISIIFLYSHQKEPSLEFVSKKQHIDEKLVEVSNT